MLSEKETWLLMADSFRNHTKPTYAGTVYGQIKLLSILPAAGLCSCKGSLLSWGKIEESTWWIINKKIKDEAIKIHGTFSGYIWPLTEDGAKSRVEFCERMAAKCML